MSSTVLARTPRIHRLARATGEWARRRTHLGVLLTAWLGLFLVAAAWSVTTPVTAAPDEPAHIIKATGVVHGDIYGDDVDGTQVRQFTEIPHAIAIMPFYTCNMFQPDVTAACATIDDSNAFAPTTTASTAGLYNPVYSYLVGWPSLFLPGSTAVYAMRLVSALITTFFAGLAVWAASLLPSSRWSAATAVLVATPSVLFLTGVVTPNALESATTAAFVAALVTAVRTRARGRLLNLLAAVMLVSGVIQVHTKSLAIVWLGLAVIIVAVWAGWARFRAFLVRPVVLAVVAAVTVSLVLSVWQTMSTGTLGQMGNYPGVGTRPIDGFFVMLDRTMEFYPSIIAMFGWGDTHPPQWIQFFYVGIGAALLLAALLGRARVRAKLAVALSVGSFVLVPAVLQAASVTNSGYIWQGRYALGLFVTMAFVAALVASEDLLRMRETTQRRILGAVVLLAGTAQSVSLIFALWRQSAGVNAATVTFMLSPSWTPPIGQPAALVVCVLAGVVFIGVAFAAITGARPVPRASARSVAAAV